MNNFIKKEKKAIFFKTKNIGDSIILTSAISALPDDYKYVDIVCFDESKPIFEMNPRVRNIFVIEKEKKGLKKIQNYLYIFFKASKERYDFLAQFSIDWRGALFARFLNAKVSVAKNNIKRGILWKKSFTFIANVALRNRPAAEQDVDLLRRAEIYKELEAPSYQIKVPSNINKQLKIWISKQFHNNKSDKLIVIHAASKWEFKEIPIQTWVDIIDTLINSGLKVVISGSKDDIHTNQRIYDLCHKKPILTENFTLTETAALLECADLLISIDSMVIHLASAVNTPVIAIFGPNNEKNWAPWKVPHKIIALSENDSPSFACRPCGFDGCGGSKISNCLQGIKSDLIVKNALAILVSR
jgi:heptosyltransferase-3